MTVVVPTRNRPDQLATALASIALQDVPLELVIVDEASTVPVAAPDMPSCVRSQVIRHDEPRGPAAARNVGASHGTAPFIAFLDDDDQWMSGKLRNCLEAFERFPEAGTVIHRMRFEGQRTRETGTMSLLENGHLRMLHRQPPHVDAVLVRRAVHEAAEFDESFPAAADLDYMLRLSLQAPIVEIDHVLGQHAVSSEGMSEIALDRRIEGRQLLLRKHRDLFDRTALSFYWMRLGHLHRRAAQRLRALSCFLRALAIDPTNIYAWKGIVAVVILRPKSLYR